MSSHFAIFCYVVLTLIARWRNRLAQPPPTKNYTQLRATSHDYAQLSTVVAFIVLSIKLVFMVLGVSYSRVLAQRPTGCCSASISLRLTSSSNRNNIINNITSNPRHYILHQLRRINIRLFFQAVKIHVNLTLHRLHLEQASMV